MRAVCEECSLPQPPDWKAGDLCVHCGKVVRRDLRCFWCAKGTPEGKFCRHCGAETVADELYGAARMLKDAGMDRFSVPSKLKEIDPEQVANFTNIYQRHAALLARHVDEVIALQRHLHFQHWAEEVEEEMIGQLPWTEGELARYSTPPTPVGNDLTVANAVRERSPIPKSRLLAALVCVLLGDDRAISDAREAFHSQDPNLRAEAAVILSHWRLLFTRELPESRWDLIKALQECPEKLERLARARRALLGDQVESATDLLDDRDPDTAFTAALAIGDVPRLEAALKRDPAMRVVAALRLANLGQLSALSSAIEEANPEDRLEILRAINQNKKRPPAKHLQKQLMRILEEDPDHATRRTAAFILAKDGRAEDALPIAQLAQGGTSIYQAILQSPNLDGRTLTEVCDYLIHEGRFTMSQFGMEDVAQSGKLPPDFVPQRLHQADDQSACELLRFAEAQLKANGDVDLHRFMIQTTLGPYSPEVRTEAWVCLNRWYAQESFGNTGPFLLAAQPVKDFFGRPERLIERLLFVLDDVDGLNQVMYRDYITLLFRYPEDDIVPYFLEEPRWTQRLRDKLVEVMKNDQVNFDVRGAAVNFVATLALHEEWLVDIGRIFKEFEGTDLQATVSYAYDRICREYEDLGEGEREPDVPNIDWD